MRAWVSESWLRFKTLWKRPQLDRDLEDELAFHLAMREGKIRAAGLPAEEARYVARRQFGNTTRVKERNREMWTFFSLENLWQDLRYGFRLLVKNPGFTCVAVLTLALGIGAATAIFSVVYGIVFRPLPYQNPERLVAIWTKLPAGGDDRVRSSMPDFNDWQSQNTVLEGLSAYAYNRYELPEEEGGESIRAALVSPKFFSMLGIRPVLGRGLAPEDDRDRVAVLSYQLWQQVFHGDTNVIGKTLRLRDHDFEVIGVMPPSFRLPTPDVTLWLSFADIYATSGNPSVGDWLTNRGLRGYGVIARLRSGVSVTEARAQMNAMEARLGQSFPEEDKGFGIELVPLRAQVVGGVQHALLLFLGAVGFLLLIACVNVGNLLLAKATIREREMAVRQALGGSVGRLIRQVLTESALLGAIGAVLGVLLAFWAVQLFLRLIPQNIPRLEDVSVDGIVLLFALAVSLAASLLFGLAPALRIRGLRLNDSLGEGGRGTQGSARSRMRGLLVSCEIAAATILVVGAALMLESFVRLASLEPGFSPDHLLTADVMASLDRYSEPWQQTKFFNEVLLKIRQLPGVRSAGACTSLPPDISQESDPFTILGRSASDAGTSPDAWYLPATPGFLGALGLPLLTGRDFSESDNAGALPVAIINQRIAREYFQRQDPLGQKINFRGIDRTIIGVAGNTTYSGLGIPADFQIYVPYAQGTFPGLHLAIRSVGDPLTLVETVRSAVREVGPEARATRISTMEQLLSQSIVAPRFYAWLLAVFGLAALILSAIGIFGVMSYSVSQRTREIGIRMAMGAERSDVLRMVIGHGLKLTLAGVAFGIAGALLLTRFLSSLLYDVRPSDPATFIAVSLLLTGVALAACYFPVRRAMRVDPLVALRYE
jgi:putative ABC transport system permease protein